jgi:PTS system nitrogen regulatory IIA component
MNLDARAAARLLCVPVAKIFEWAQEGALPCYKVQEQLRFNRVELLEWAAARRMKVAPELFGEERPAERRGAGNGFRLSRALASGGVFRDVAGESERVVLRTLAMLLPLPPEADRETVAELFAAREGVTPVGDGIAIPHARAPAVLPLGEPLLALAFLARPLDLRARDKKPVHALFAVFSPTVRAHLDALSKIARALTDATFHGLVARAAPTEEILARLAAIESEAVGEAGGGGADFSEGEAAP